MEPRRDGASIPHIVSAWSTSNGLAPGQLKVPDKTNEINAIPSLIRALSLHGCTVTIDARGCQKRVAGEVVAAGADYVFPLKGNLETMRDFLETIPSGPPNLGGGIMRRP